VLKALNDNIALFEIFAKTDIKNISHALLKWNESQMRFAQEQSLLTKRLGEALVTTTPDWENMTSESMRVWWQNVMAQQSWYATNSSVLLPATNGPAIKQLDSNA